MKKEYITPSINIVEIPVVDNLLEASYTPPEDYVPGGGSIGDGDGYIDDARRRNSSYSRGGATYVESNGGWSRGGLW